MFLNKGISGAEISLIKKKDKFIVRKKANKIEVSSRLKNQYSKILYFKCNYIGKPKILNSGYRNQLFYYDMNYINGQTLENFIIKKPLSVSLNIFKKLIFFKKKKKKKKYFVNNISKKINLKIDELEKKIIKKKKINILKKKIEFLKKTNWKYFPISENHGDLSLENILIDGKYKINFIDMNKNFVDSYLLDISKLIFDFNCDWSVQKNQINSIKTINYRLKYDYIKNYVLENFKFMLTKKEQYFIKRLLILDILRILPYIKSNYLEKKLINKLKNINI